MFKGTPEIITQRREEIVAACEQLYQTMSFKDITLKEISSVTSFSRPTIYNYFHTKEEIFLALFEREYDRWNADLEKILNREKEYSGKELAEQIAKSLEKRSQLLKLLSMNNFDMEENSREELLASFKRAYGQSLKLFREILGKHFSGMSEAEAEQVMYIFFPFMFGIYPYAEVTAKQKDAMAEAEVDYKYQSIYEITYNCLIKLLGSSDQSGKYDTQHPMPEGSARAETYNPVLDKLEVLNAELKRLADKYNVGPAQIPVAWAIAKGTLPIIGVTKTNHVEDAVKAANIELTAEETAELEKVADSLEINAIRFWEKEMK